MFRRSFLGLTALALCASLGFGATHALAAKGAKKGVKGKIESVDATAKSFVITNKKAGTTTTVSTTDTTKYVKEDQSAGAFTDLKAGEKVQVSGAAPVDNKMTATTVKLVAKKKAKKADKA